MLFFNYFMDGSWAISTIKGINRSPSEAISVILEVLAGFSLGAESIALFARVGGGIYTKAADVGADLVGKVEAGIPEDDPRNPAVIADNVGDNVGDVAGMGSDLFESYVGSIISAITLGVLVLDGYNGILFPMLLAAVGIFASIIGSFFVRGKEGSNPQRALDMGTYVSGILVVIASFFLSNYFTGGYSAFIAIVAGLAVGIIIGKLTEYYTSEHYKPVQHIAQQSETGAATTIISGLAVGMKSTSVLGSPSINSSMTCASVRPSKRMACRPATSGMYTSSSSARALSTLSVLTPSATSPRRCTASSKLRPSPRAYPTC